MNDTDTNGDWSEYRKLYLADRKRNDDEHKTIFTKLDAIILSLERKKGEDRMRMIVLNLGIPALVAVSLTLLTLFAAL